MTYGRYLVALVLIEEGDKRAMPLGGKSIKEPLGSNDNPGAFGEELAKELLLRVFQRSENGSLRRAAGSRSLLVIHISLESMQDDLPRLKSEWIQSGDFQQFISGLKIASEGVWSLSFSRENGITYSSVS